ncbi:hypothetical protein ACIRBX_30850 [Kitasatospora sp. NPDC096147]|uniref:hypothetical protein n=1 Tax=Kitasatospora sp. NPDC096147 TaxID=3364093 RepID=UPI0038119C51
MRNGLVQLGAWTAATGAAVALSWFGVHAVLAETAYEQPTALQLPSSAANPPSDAPSTPAAPSAEAVSTEAVTPSPSPTASAPAIAPLGTPAPSPSRTPAKKPSPTPSAPSAPAVAATTPPADQPNPAPVSSVRSYRVPGGLVALDMQPTTAELVSATPDKDWQMQIWQGDKWLRVDFTKDGATNSVFATWNGHHPDVQTVVR